MAVLREVEKVLPGSGSKIAFEHTAVSLTCREAFELMLGTAVLSSWEVVSASWEWQ